MRWRSMEMASLTDTAAHYISPDNPVSIAGLFEAHLFVVLIIVGVVVAVATSVKPVFTHLAEIIRASGTAVANVLTACAVPIDAMTRYRVYMKAAKKATTTEEFERLIRLHPGNANLPKDRRMTDDRIVRIVAPPRKARPDEGPDGRSGPNGQLLRLQQPPKKLRYLCATLYMEGQSEVAHADSADTVAIAC